ncbi:MAG: glycoside hydrolase family 18 protein [Prolixibacteraceae bacterium]
MKKLFTIVLLFSVSVLAWGQYRTSLPRTWDDYPPELQKPGFGVHKSELIQMDDSPILEKVLLFSAHNGHYPYFDLFKNYYVVIDNYSKQVKYISDVTISTERDLQLEDRDNDGKYELYRKYFKDGKFSVDKEGNHLKVVWYYDNIEFGKKLVVAYLTSWSDVMPDPNFVTHINYAFGHVTNSFNGVSIDNEERLRVIVELKKMNPALKIALSIGGWGSGRFSEMASDENNRKQFATDCRRVVEEFSLDGIDIDWEYPTSDMAKISSSPDDKKNFTLLMKDIREAIGNKKLLTLASSAFAKYIDFRAIDPYIDFVNIMGYDMGMPPHHHAALFRSEHAGGITSEEAVNKHIAAGVPIHKLVLGVPLYGKGDKKAIGDVDYKSLERQSKHEVKWDEVAKVPYLVDSKGEMIYTYENPKSLAFKCEYILSRDLLGGMYWAYDDDDEAATLIKTVYRTLRK